MRGHIEQIYRDSQGVFQGFFTKYLEHVTYLTRAMDLQALNTFTNSLIGARARGATVFVVGNGGSAANASHFAEDLALAAGGTEAMPFRVISLVDAVPFMTASGNDRGFDHIFVDQLKSLYREGDILVAISCSGNSSNILKAIDYVNERRGITIGILGFNGGQAKETCQQTVLTPTPHGEYGAVESIQQLFFHIIVDYLFFKLRSH